MADKQDDTRRSFDFLKDENTVVKYYLGIPTSDQIRKADWHYSKVYNRALAEGVFTQAEMVDTLRERGILGPDHDKRRDELEMGISVKTVEMQESDDSSTRINLAVEIADLRNRLYQWNQRLSGPLSNTCEQIADDAKMEYLTSSMVQKEDGVPVWSAFESFVNEKDSRLLIKSRYEVLLLMNGLEGDFLEKTPENLVLREEAEKAQARQNSRQLEASTEEQIEQEQVEPEALEEEVPVRKKRQKKG